MKTENKTKILGKLLFMACYGAVTNFTHSRAGTTSGTCEEFSVRRVMIFSWKLAGFEMQNSYWSHRNVPFPEPHFPYGNFKDLWKSSAATFSSKIYSQMAHSGRFFGLYFFLEPILVVTDLDLIKAIMIGVERNDFLNLLLELEKKGVDLSMNEIAAQSFMFFAAGFETSSSTQTFCLYELSLRPEIQDKARNCVVQALEKHGGLTYEAVCDMGYFDQCINETLRKYPTLPILERQTFKDYQIPDSDVIIQKGVRIQIPVYAIQHDERYYPDPDRFDPDRFNPEQAANRHIGAFLPFGEGPRVCIGQRFGMLQSRVGIATVLSKSRVSSCAMSQVPLQISSKSAVLQPRQGVWLRVEPL
ncbi:probable cytochrome P450 6a13 [Culex pipiens pallens]|uniref:probable cytochrome P450 6a13 n=1 Tax=Culex pipiens pallens TaxID=42434 RepID=UPI0019548C48|nr:probable cytochrome P450 6a13 [Culex pipiens pallens]